MNKPARFSAESLPPIRAAAPTDRELKAIQFTGACTIQAAAQTEEGGERKLPTVSLEAYNGGVMQLAYWGRSVVDIAGMSFREKMPILYNHSVDTPIGQTDAVKASGSIQATGQLMGDTEEFRKVVSLAKDGFGFQCSIGAKPQKYSYLESGQQTVVNGQTVTGPCYVITQSSLYEISICPLGADDSTSAQIAATQQPKENDMPAPATPQPAAAAETDLRAAESARLEAVRKACKDHPDVYAKAVTEGWDESKARDAVKDAIIAAQAKQITDLQTPPKEDPAEALRAGRPQAPFVSTPGTPEMTRETIAASAALSAGVPRTTLEKSVPTQALEIAANRPIRCLSDLLISAARLAGADVSGLDRHDHEGMLRAAFSTRDISLILADVQNKAILAGYGTVEQVWRRVSAIRSVKDFKKNHGVRLVLSSLLQSLGPDGEIKHGKLSDEGRDVQADTKALMLAITRKDIINDDLGVLTDVPTRLGFAAARTLNTDFYAALFAKLATAFTNDRGNRATGALSYDALKAADALFGALKDSEGNPIGVEGSILFTGPKNRATALELYKSTNMTGGNTKSPAANIFAGTYAPVVSSYITDTSWFIVSNPMAVPLMEVAFLDGREEPFIESADADFNRLGIQSRCVFDYGAAFAEYLAAVYSPGT